MGDSRTGGGAGNGAPGRDDEPLTLERLIARQGAGPSGRRAARRTGEVPIPLLPGESLPAHRGPRPAVPPVDAARRSAAPAEGARRSAAPAGSAPARPPVGPSAPAVRGLPAVPAAPPQRPQLSQPVAPLPGNGAGVRFSQPVPPLPGNGAGVRFSQPVPPLPGGGPAALHPPARRANPLPPIPGLEAPGRSGATAAPRPPRRETRAARRASRSPGRRRLIRLTHGVAALVGLVLAYHLGLYVYVDRSIERVDALAVGGPEIIAPQLQEGAATYLVVGTGLPGADGPAGVAALLARVAPDEESAVLISVPPTALVDTPACRGADGNVREPTTEAFADSLLDGGPACMVRAVQQLSGLRVDHYLGVDLDRLPDMVDALDGVAVCLPTATEAGAAAAVPLPSGASDLDGEQAAGYLRPGDSGTDVTGTAIAERAQVLLTSTLRQAMSLGVLGNPVRLTSFLTSAADALTVDESTNLGDLSTLARTLGDLSGEAVQRTVLPVAQVGYVPAGTDQAYVVLDRSATRALFETVIEEGRLPEEALPDDAPAETPPPAAEAAPEQAPAPPAEQPLTAAPAAITLDVLNGTGTVGLAATVSDALRAQGFTIGTVGNEPGEVAQSVVRHGAGAVEQARTVVAAVPGAVLQASDAIGDTALQLVIGPGYSTVVPVQIPAPEAAAAVTPSAAEPPADALAAAAEPASSAVSCS